jgi:hypothetical protein
VNTVAKPKVFISYTWRPDDPKDPNDNPVARGLKFADQLRAAGLDSRIDQYFRLSRFGFVPRQKRTGDQVEPWVMWAGEQIADVDFVLLVCTAQYAADVCKSPLGGDLTLEQWYAMPDEKKFELQKYQLEGKEQKQEDRGKVPYTWWDWHFIMQDMKSGRVGPEKFIPVGFGPYSLISRYVPFFVKGANYYNLDAKEDFDGLLRGIKTQFRILHPREGIFVSYSHKDKKLFNEFNTMIAPAIQRGVVDIWDDTKIAPGAKWRDEIQDALGSAKVAVLLVSQNFLESKFIAQHELPPLLKAAEDEGVIVFWIYLSSCLYEKTEIVEYQAAHDVSRPLDRRTKPERQAILSEVCAKLIQLAGSPDAH